MGGRALCMGVIGGINSGKRQAASWKLEAAQCFYFQLPACRCRSEMRLRILREDGTGYALQMDMHAVGEVLEALGQVGQT